MGGCMSKPDSNPAIGSDPGQHPPKRKQVEAAKLEQISNIAGQDLEKPADKNWTWRADPPPHRDQAMAITYVGGAMMNSQ